MKDILLSVNVIIRRERIQDTGKKRGEVHINESHMNPRFPPFLRCEGPAKCGYMGGAGERRQSLHNIFCRQKEYVSHIIGVKANDCPLVLPSFQM